MYLSGNVRPSLAKEAGFSGGEGDGGACRSAVSKDCTEAAIESCGDVEGDDGLLTLCESLDPCQDGTL